MGEGVPRPGASAAPSLAVSRSESSVPTTNPAPRARRVNHVRRVPSSTPIAPFETLNEVIDAYCIDCHSNDLQLGNLSLEGFDIARADTARLKSEKMIRKLRAEMMPLAGRPRPPSDTLQMLATAIAN